ncbi:unnamed protein product [Meganyctiphanes norvegica]|uniref:SUN domain-containing ossification factor n=1 Tax=Meganyctiphanes norvegica TaxID=48144 RepID=A0AAV2PQH9_MEGNR
MLSVDELEPAIKIEEVEPEKKKASETKESDNKDAASGVASSQEKKSKKKQEKQQKEEQKEQVDVEKTNGDKHHGNVHSSVNVGMDVKEPDNHLGEEIPATTPSPVEPPLHEPKIPQTPTNKESVMVRLSNKIKVLESNVTISSAYLEELSRRYKRQMEDMYKAFNTTAQVAYERDLQHQKDISELKEQLETVSGIVTELQSERESLANTVVEQHLLLMLLEVLVLTIVFTWCNRRRRIPETNSVTSGDTSTGQRTEENRASRTEEESNWPPQYYKSGHQRRNSLDSVMGEREVRPRRQRRHSEEALNITGTYSDLLIIEPAIPIMMDSPPERKKKRKSGSLNLKRSKSNSNIRRGDKYSPNARRVKEKAERVSSAGVLFVGDQQVSGSGDATPVQSETNELHNHTQNDETLDTSLDNSRLSQDYTQRSYVDEIDGGVGLGGGSGGGGNDSIECCANCDALGKSRAVSLTKSLSLNGKDREKKVKKVKRSKSINKSDNKDNIYNEHNYASKNGSVSFGYETTLPFGGYCYDSRDLTEYTHYTNAAHLNGHNSYDYYSGYYNDPRTEADRLVTSWVSSSPGYDPLLPSMNGQRGYEDLSSKTKLRSDNWEWYAGMVPSTETTERRSGDTGQVAVGSSNSSEAISTCSDSSGKNQRSKSQEKKTRSGKKKKNKGPKNPNVVVEELGEEVT